MKIGILTYIREYANLGTNMQSYCTLKAIQKQFPSDVAELIDFSAWRPAKKPYLSQISIQSLFNDYKRIRKFDHFFKSDLTFSPKRLITADLEKAVEFIKKQNYDAIYVGSDTILELKGATQNKLTAYWLDESIHCKKFLIAASALNVTFEGLSEQRKEKIRQTLDHFSLLGVRDEATYRLLSHFVQPGDKRLQLMPDPTFTFEIDYSFIEKYIARKKLKFEKPIVCLHLLRGTAWASKLADSFRKEGYMVASLRPAHYADIIFTDLSAFEQIGLYKYFQLVITHRYHDSIFSIKNLTPVIFFPEHFTDITIHGDNKSKTLFQSFNIPDNFIGDLNKLNATYLFDFHKPAISNFNRQMDTIKANLIANNEHYEAFVKESGRILHLNGKLT